MRITGGEQWSYWRPRPKELEAQQPKIKDEVTIVNRENSGAFQPDRGDDEVDKEFSVDSEINIIEELSKKKDEMPRITITPYLYYSGGSDLGRIARSESPQAVQWVMMDVRKQMQKVRSMDASVGQISRVIAKMNKVISSGSVKIKALRKEGIQRGQARRAQAKRMEQVRQQEKAEKKAEQAVKAYREQRRKRRAAEYRAVGVAGGASIGGEVRINYPDKVSDVNIPGAEPLAPILPGANQVPGAGLSAPVVTAPVAGGSAPVIGAAGATAPIPTGSIDVLI